MQASIAAIEYCLPERVVSNRDLAAEFPEWPVEKIQGKTGIAERHVAAGNECASDLAVAACRKLFAGGACSPDEIDYLLFCTQSPDYFLPTTACLVQHRLGIPTNAGALDFNLGCSGFVYGLGLAHGLIQTGQASKLLLVTAETYTKFIHPRDRSVRTLFGDAAAVTLLTAAPGASELRSSYVFGTDGSGANNLIVPAGGLRQRCTAETAEVRCDAAGNARNAESLFMDGAEIFNFTLRTIPECIAQLLDRSGKDLEQVDLFVFHQANQFILDHLRAKLKIPREKFYVWLESCGNTVSSTIPIALKHAIADGRLRPGQTVMLVGFGVGYSWGATLLEWPTLGFHRTKTAEKERRRFPQPSVNRMRYRGLWWGSVMSTQPKTFITPEQYLEIERKAEYKSEYLNGEMFAMAGGTDPHSLIAVNINSDLHHQTRNRQCWVYSSDMRVQVEATNLYTYPDVSAVCGERKFLDGRRDTLLNPSFIVEVLSSSTEAYDRGRKFAHYKKIDSLAEYLLISSEEMHADLFRRMPDGSWTVVSAEKPEDVLELPSIGCRLVMADVYEKVEF